MKNAFVFDCRYDAGWKQVIGSKFKIEKDYPLKKRIERFERQIKTLSLKKKAPHY